MVLHVVDMNHERLTYFPGGLEHKLTGVAEASPVRAILG